MKDVVFSVVLPVYNQEDHITSVISEYSQALDRLNFPYEIILVTNGCRDNSVKLCFELEKKIPQIRHIESPQQGWGSAVRLGLSVARGDILCYTNLARTTPDVLVLLLLYSQTFPNAVIKANRKIRDNWVRRLGSLLYNLQCRALFDLSYWDINGTPKVFSRKFCGWQELQENSDLIDLEFNIVCRRTNQPVLEIPIFSHGRHGGKSTTSWRSARRLYLGALRLWWQLRLPS
ncbi:MAG: glycosyltransferase [Blastochloris sp.]|nr:glycosyltransferase [Blastochloris sp.]